MVAVPRLMTTETRTPARMAGSARGSSTETSRRQPLMPMPSAASSVVCGICLNARSTSVWRAPQTFARRFRRGAGESAGQSPARCSDLRSPSSPGRIAPGPRFYAGFPRGRRVALQAREPGPTFARLLHDAVRYLIVGRLKPLDGVVDFIALAFEVTNLADDLMRLQLPFEIGRVVCTLAADQIVDLSQGETQLLSLENHTQAHSVCVAIEARIAFPARLDEAAALIIPQRAEANAVGPRHLADRQLRLSWNRCGVHVRVRRAA